MRASAFAEMWADIMTKPIVFGLGNNPVNFVSVADVAAAVARAAAGTGLRGQVITVAGPDNLPFNQLAALLQELRGQHGPIRHVPRWLLRAMAPASRQARAAIAMDTTDMTTGPPAALRRNELPATDIRAHHNSHRAAAQLSPLRGGAGVGQGCAFRPGPRAAIQAAGGGGRGAVR